MKRLTLHVVLAGAFGLAGCGGNDPAPQSPPPQVGVITVTTQPVTLERELPGRTSPFLVAEVRPQVSGIVAKQLFTEGGLVRSGQPLYQLDDASYRANYQSAQAGLAKAEAALGTAQLTARRFAELVKTGAVSAQDAENAEAALQQANADVAAAKAALASARVTLGYARITAPISGRIGKSSVTRGALVTANQDEPLSTVQQLDPIYVDLTQSSRELLQLRRQMQAGTVRGTTDMPVQILLEDGSRYSHDGRLQFADVTVDQATGSFSLRVAVPNPDNVLLPGMYVRAVLDTGVRPEGLLVPQQGINRDPKGNATALVVGKDDKVEERVVKASLTIGDKWLIDDGLKPGDRVIVEGLQKVQPGVRVQVVDVSVAAANASAPAKSAM
ncbi:MAG: efflux RND transporter periplasmic adaptor subunit [Gammaproteobacteria bacterium]